MVDEVSTVSEQTAAEATNVSAASEEQASSLSEAAASIEQLSQLAAGLHDDVADFEVGDDEDGSPAATTADATEQVEPTEESDSGPTTADSGTAPTAETDGGSSASHDPTTESGR